MQGKPETCRPATRSALPAASRRGMAYSSRITMSTMKAVRCHRYAGLDPAGRPVPTPDPLRDVLALDEVPAPVCEAGHVLVRTHFAGVQYPDALQAQGLYQHKPDLPYVPGMDVAGTVLEAGVVVDVVQGELFESACSRPRPWGAFPPP